MRLSECSKELYFSFFKECGVCDSDFPEVKIYVRKGARILTSLLAIDGITFGNSIFLHPRYSKRKSDGRLYVSKELLVHEIAHVLQYRKVGKAVFLKTYIRDFWAEFRRKSRWTLRAWFEAYQRIPYEIEAREQTREFRLWLEKNQSD